MDYYLLQGKQTKLVYISALLFGIVVLVNVLVQQTDSCSLS